MRDRIIDIGLTTLLIVVAFGITWTLFTLDRNPGRSGADRPPAATESEPTGRGTGIVPLAPDGDDPPAAASEGGGTTAAPAGTVPEPAAEPAPSAEAPAEAAAPEPEPAPLEPVPEGAVELDRVGFSFVTGGAGACGIVLEPWRHVAVSRDLLARYGCGSEITVRLADEKNGRREVAAVVADTMNPVHSRTVNVYVGQDEPALQYGVTTGVLEP